MLSVRSSDSVAESLYNIGEAKKAKHINSSVRENIK